MKPANPSAQHVFWGMDREEVSAYATSLPPEEATARADCARLLSGSGRTDAENFFEELKNQWGFSGFCSGKAVASEMAVPTCC